MLQLQVTVPLQGMPVSSEVFPANSCHFQRFQRRVAIKCNRRDKLKIICDPFRPSQKEEDSRPLDFHKCYDLLNLHNPGRGLWVFLLSFVGDDDDVQMQLEFWYHSFRGNTRKMRGHQTRTFHVYFDNGTNSIQVGDRTGGIVEPINTTIFDPADHSDDDSDDSSDGDDDDDDGPPGQDVTIHANNGSGENRSSRGANVSYSYSSFELQVGDIASQTNDSGPNEGPEARRGRGVKPSGSLRRDPHAQIDFAEHQARPNFRSAVRGGRVGKRAQTGSPRRSSRTKRVARM